MTADRINDRLLVMAARSVVEQFKQQGKTFTKEQEDSFVQDLIGLTRMKPPTDSPIHDLVVTTEIVRDALIARDKDKGFEAITVLLLQWMQTFNYSEVAFKMMPLLGEIKDSILAEHFKEAQETLNDLLVLLGELSARSLNSGPRRLITKTREKKETVMGMTLYYRESIANGGLVFAEPKRAEYIARVHDAITESKTWGEFRKRMPKAEYSKLMKWRFDEDGIRRPRSTDPFSMDAIPQYYDGDYPDWLQQEMDVLLPEEILEKYGTMEQTMLNGDYLHIEKEHEKAICEDLEKLGYKIIKREDLTFY